MTVHFTLTSANEAVRRHVADFARGLGCTLEPAAAAGALSFRAALPDAATLIELLTDVALAATKEGIDISEPVCHLAYQYERVASEVTLGIRLADFSIAKASTAGT